MRVSNYLTSEVSFHLLGCSHDLLESSLGNCAFPENAFCLQCAPTEDRSIAALRLLLIGSSLPGRGKSWVVNLNCYWLFVPILAAENCLVVETEFAVGCTFYCLQFSVLCAFKSPSLLSSKERGSDQECCQLQLHAKNIELAPFCLDAHDGCWRRAVLGMLVPDWMASRSARSFCLRTNIQAYHLLFPCFFVSPLWEDYLSLSLEVSVHFVTILVVEAILVSQ